MSRRHKRGIWKRLFWGNRKSTAKSNIQSAIAFFKGCVYVSTVHHACVCLRSVKITLAPASCVVLCNRVPLCVFIFLSAGGWTIFHDTPRVPLVHMSRTDTAALATRSPPLCSRRALKVHGVGVVLHSVGNGLAVQKASQLSGSRDHHKTKGLVRADSSSGEF